MKRAKAGIASGVGNAEYGRIAMAFLAALLLVPLIAALKAARSDAILPAANRATAPLYFVNPIRAFEERASRIFSTHPRTIDRVNRLRALQGLPPMAGDRAIHEDQD